ncbi:hypothetical protein N7510_004111 [Penicillium lagena]|uniref:uncharacterized protein n=1 Tax=Penicillium lagena TaxID=94218 RepID=UPI00254043FC|nr:uncharacterized protein N7510_004111 [Penicillium lagena]KAJ5620127.1 hypothetical protein N7510_004111 [Penicillium lagena]
MPYLLTSQAFLEQSALLLEAYPETTRITTKYSFPTETPGQLHKRRKSQRKPQDTTSTPSSNTQTTTEKIPLACLTLKTFNPGTGITLKYRTNKGAEVSRLMTGLGKLAAGADVASLGVSGAGPTGAAGDVEMGEAPALDEGVAASSPTLQAAGTQTQTTGKAAGGKGKKKGGKGKR